MKMFFRITLLSLMVFFYGGLLLTKVFGHEVAYNNILYGLGIIPFDFPFVDSHQLLSAAQCSRQGLDIFISNPCDVLNRPLNYGATWLWLIPSFMTTEHTPILGLGLDVAFLFAISVLLRPSTWLELIYLAAACVSTMVTFALERGNADLFIFILVTLAVAFYRRSPTSRLVAYAIYLFAGTLKFYPVVLLATVLREPLRRAVIIALIAVVALIFFIVYEREGLRNALNVIPPGIYFGDLFGAKNLPLGVAVLHFAAFGAFERAATALLFLSLIAIYFVVVILFARRFIAQQIAIDWSAHEFQYLLVGAILLSGCFLAGQNIGYRGIFFLFALPGLIAVRRANSDHMLRYVLFLTVVAIPILMWEEGIRHSFEFLLRAVGLPDKIPGLPSELLWLSREFAWWMVISVLTALIVLWTVQTQSSRKAFELWSSRRMAHLGSAYGRLRPWHVG